MPSDTHIVPVVVGDPEKSKEMSDLLLAEHGIYVQPMNSPTVPRGSQTAAHHADALSRDDALAGALLDGRGVLDCHCDTTR